MWVNLDEQEITERALILVCKLKSSSSVTHSTVSSMVQNVSQLFDDLVGSLKENTNAFLHSQNIETQSDAALQLFEKFDIYQKSFCGVETDYKQSQYLLASRKFVPPVEKEITVGYAQRSYIQLPGMFCGYQRLECFIMS